MTIIIIIIMITIITTIIIMMIMPIIVIVILIIMNGKLTKDIPLSGSPIHCFQIEFEFGRRLLLIRSRKIHP